MARPGLEPGTPRFSAVTSRCSSCATRCRCCVARWRVPSFAPLIVPCSPWQPAVRTECLNWLVILNRRHLERVLRIFVKHYNVHRPHRALQLQPPQPREPLPTPAIGEIQRHDRLGGLIHEYYRDAA
jgi:hypothetical protein